MRGACDGQAVGPSGLGLWVALPTLKKPGLAPHPNSPQPSSKCSQSFKLSFNSKF